jgi:hypothetical protein
MYGINYNGLRKRDTYDELIDYVMNKQEKIKYPNRTAKFLRESPQLSNLLDGDDEGLLEMEGQQKRQVQEAERENIIRNMAGWSVSAQELRTVNRPNFLPQSDFSGSDYVSAGENSDYGSAVSGDDAPEQERRIVNRPNLLQSCSISQGDSDFDSAVDDFHDDISDELEALRQVEREKRKRQKQMLKACCKVYIWV